MAAYLLLLSLALCPLSAALPWLEDQVDWNLNTNQETTDPNKYSGSWDNHVYHESPANWRFPFYTVTLDRFVNGDPTNDDANATAWEHDIYSNQFRFGGDIKGLANSLDYIQGMGIKGIYLAGTPMINMPWAADGYSPLDLTLLDHHHGVIQDWRDTITDIHERGMYIILDNTYATMGDLMSFVGYENDTNGTPFAFGEHDYTWKTDRVYWDFQPGNDYNASCNYPQFWYDGGYEVGSNVTDSFVGCKNSDFNQYGEVSAFGAYPDWQRQVSKFAYVQDRLRDWDPTVRSKIEVMSCLTVAMLDIDGFRMDKALQIVVESQAKWSQSMRECAVALNKTNFFITGEVVDGNTFGAIYYGRGKVGSTISNLTHAVSASNVTNEHDYAYLRDDGAQALDSAAFHYSIYRALTVFLGIDGNIGAVGDTPYNFIHAWTDIVSTNDLVNANTGLYDPRHMFGVTNQDVFRWPALSNGTQKQLIGFFITTLLMPGIPLVVWGEEQAQYVLDNEASNYVFSRAPMSSNQAWQMHGCYKLGEVWYTDMPLDAALTGCEDDSISLDHKDSSHPVRNILKRMYQLREEFPVLNDGWVLQQLSNVTHKVAPPGGGTAAEVGVWSALRGQTTGVQDLSTEGGQGNQSVWMIYTNDNKTIDHTFDCDGDTAMISPFPVGTTVRNLFYPYETYNLSASTMTDDSCLPKLSLKAWEYKALVPEANFVEPLPVITKVVPGHDQRILSNTTASQTVAMELQFSMNMTCDDVTDSFTFNSTTHEGETLQLDTSSIECGSVTQEELLYVGGLPTAWTYKANFINVYEGVHQWTVNNVSAADGSSINAVDRFMFRIGKKDNPMVFVNTETKSTIYQRDTSTGEMFVVPNAPGADKWRYSTNWGSSYSNWMPYNSSNVTVTQQTWTGTKAQAWTGEHIIMDYWSQKAGSADHTQQADLVDADVLATDTFARRYPHIFTQGAWNSYGYDSGIANKMKLVADNTWNYTFMAEWPNTIAFNVWGMNPSGMPDDSIVYGDVDGDFILDRVPPVTLLKNNVSLPVGPGMPYLSWRVSVNDATLKYSLEPEGSAWGQIIMFILMVIVPPMTGILAILAFKKSFYGVKFNYVGVNEKSGFFGGAMWTGLKELRKKPELTPAYSVDDLLAMAVGAPGRRKVLIATMEYEIEDWAIKIKIGGLGVMASLMGKNLGHQDLIWVVPCVGGIDYPEDQRAEPMTITILGLQYDIQVQYHVVRNITYVLLDAPVFRGQSKAEPYPARMDDVESAVYYSAWNSCIAQAIKRFNPDIYHINDYHGTVAPLHLLPETIPVCLSLHNAEFQGLWPMRNKSEIDEVCSIFNLPQDVAKEYVQFGEVFNLLHAAASYLRVHQKGFGAVGVSKKYGVRSFARYAIFWGLSKIGSLPNPDPSDQGEFDKNEKRLSEVVIDRDAEAGRGALRMQAQEWAGLKKDPNAELFVFVGRWSMQKGIDLIADVFPSVLENNPNVQLITVGPVIDLYGKFAAMKLDAMMAKYPGRVCSKPVFTMLPPFIFSGAEFALIPSRDEPFGLVAVEFGRKGALGVGARVGGLGQMPGWWFTVESVTTKHLIKQFKTAIQGAISSTTEVRANMRARSALQRFPVAQWVEDLGILQSKSIARHQKHALKSLGNSGAVQSSLTLAPLPPPGGGMSSSASSVFSPTASTVDLSAEPIVTSSAIGPSAMNPARLRDPSVPGTPTDSPRNSYFPSQSARQSQLSIPSIARTATSKRLKMTRKSGSSSFSLGGASDDESDNETVLAPGTGRVYAHGQQSNSNVNSSGTRSSSFESRTADRTLLELQQDELLGISSFDPEASPARPNFGETRANSTLSLSSVVGERKDFELQAVDPFFTDSTGQYGTNFKSLLTKLEGKNSENSLCIEEFLKKSEKQWYNRFYSAKLGYSSSPSTPGGGGFSMPWDSKTTLPSHRGSMQEAESPPDTPGGLGLHQNHEFGMDENHVAPTGLLKFMQLKIGDWPVYSFILAFGQIIAANSYQITLIIGQNGEAASELYVVASIYLAASAAWWGIFRTFKAIYSLAVPFFFYGMAFFLVGIVPFIDSSIGKTWTQNVATAMYAIASASGSLYFAMNFGSEGGAAVESWAFRACVIQGSQQIYVSGLWYWGSTLAATINSGLSAATLITSKKVFAAVTMPIAVLLWTLGLLLYFGLPSFYRQKPGTVPSFYRAVARRKIIGWFLVMVVLQNYWMSAPYGRNWSYLWSSSNVPAWSIVLILLFFFVFIWACFLGLFGYLSKADSWIIPVFAIGLGAPRWCQMLWGISNIGLYVPWAGGPVGSAIAGRSLWCWLGVLDAVQGVGFGMILLQTLTRLHVTFALIAAQIIGSVATIVARATAPDQIGPGTVFPDFSATWEYGLKQPAFWFGLICQIVICIGFALFFRKEQLMKP